MTKFHSLPSTAFQLLPAFGPGDPEELPSITVLGLQRCATKAVLHFLKVNFSGRYRILHMHGVAARYRAILLSGLNTGTPKFLEKKQEFQRGRRILSTSSRRILVVPIRNPVSRIYSFYLYKHRERLPALYDVERDEFSERDSMAADFAVVARKNAAFESYWYRENLLEPFGFDISKIEVPTKDVATVASFADTDVIIVWSETISSTLPSAVERFCGPVTRPVAVRNGMEGFNLGVVAKAFKKQFSFPPEAFDILAACPEVGHLHGPLVRS